MMNYLIIDLGMLESLEIVITSDINTLVKSFK